MFDLLKANLSNGYWNPERKLSTVTGQAGNSSAVDNV